MIRYMLPILALVLLAIPASACDAYSLVTPGVNAVQTYGYFAPPVGSYGYLAAPVPVQYGYAAPVAAVPLGYGGAVFGAGGYGVGYGFNRGFGYGGIRSRTFLTGHGFGIRSRFFIR